MDASGDTPRSSSVQFSRRDGLLRKAVISFMNSGLSAGLGFLVKNEKIEQQSSQLHVRMLLPCMPCMYPRGTYSILAGPWSVAESIAI